MVNTSNLSRGVFTGRPGGGGGGKKKTLVSAWLEKSIILVVGIAIGSIFFAPEDSRLTTMPSSSSLLLCKSNEPPPQQQQHNNNNNINDGWQSIDVFYGSTDHVVSQLPAGQKWFSQAAQEQVVLSLLKGKREGYFIDLASNDATMLSNTYILERDYGWTGLCIEPNPVYWYNLTHYRPNCKLVAAVVGQKTMEQVSFRFAGNEHGGIAGKEFDNGLKWKNRSPKVYTVSLVDVFRRNNVPKLIDYLSLDVEGAEGFIMSVFPLNEYKIKLLTVERPKEELIAILESHGYKNIQRLSSWGESLWAHQDFLEGDNALDQTNLDLFHGRLQKKMEPYTTIVKPADG